MNRLLTILAIITGMAAAANAQQTEITGNVHLRDSAHYEILGDISTKATQENTRLYVSGTCWNIQTDFSSTERTVRFWVDNGGSMSEERTWRGDVRLFRIDGENSVCYGIVYNQKQDLTVYKNNKESKYIIYSPPQEKEEGTTIIDLNRTFKLSGRVTSFMQTTDASDMKSFGDGWTWHLENQRIGGNNHPAFWIEGPGGRKHHYSYWSDGINIQGMKQDNGTTAYFVADDMFIHLTILDNGIVSLCSKLRK